MMQLHKLIFMMNIMHASPGLTEPLHQDQVPTAEQGRYDGGEQNTSGQAQYRQAVIHRAHRKVQKILKS